MTNPPIPAITKRAPTIDFIDQRLPKHHPLFATQTVQYDVMSGQYQAVGASNSGLVSTAASNAPSSSNSLVSRPEVADLNAMPFWNEIFADSMSQFKSTPEPKGRSKSLYDIREKTDWHAVYDTLQMARKKYETSGGIIRDMRRKVADRITPGAEVARIGSKVTPQDKIVTPILGAVELILGAVEIAALVRKKALAGLDDMVPVFSKVELFLSMFKEDANIRNASIDLTAVTLAAVERTIGFFISSQFARTGKALLSGEDYQKGLIESFETIQTKSHDLWEQAQNSHMFESHVYYQEDRRIQAQMGAKIDLSTLVAVQGFNAVNNLLNDLAQQMDQKIDRMLQPIRQENISLRIENDRLRSTSPTRTSMWLPPPQPIPGLVSSWSINQETLRNIIDVHDLDLTDLALVQDRKEQLPSRDRSRAEQVTNTQLFRSWIVSPSSTKLLIHWDSRLPKMIAEVSPLTVFCTTMAQALRSNPRFLSALWFCGQHIDAYEFGARSGGQMMIGSLLDQLLRQWDFNTEPLHNYIGYDSLQKGDVEALTALLGFLIGQLPPEIVLFLIIDGAALFEREEVQDALPVFLSLIQLVADNSVRATVKLLITSTPGTDIIRGSFEEEDLILNVDSLPILTAASEERMVRELEGELHGDVP
ncbi:hypothetical protein DPSP01_001567 [Paraphaeosphaeria sporulosa]|uniref:Fungal STAND N-terminal Goodbye domain-containing protein n=1 Tax=Paraphaeosphaeria sporulosa TaxID=1460663 RepID=A0A177CGL4_9PLEO|nr:uncharacterized protein CC84DRAFT_619656 [Paraphaeosphaeria sporulosa]OAG06723.1 hypothetical protein CC84DRAFT_619656 [Paraphaeosphaeria sporulosa]